jgi:beta-glucosidase-like glycosyl hydrolase
VRAVESGEIPRERIEESFRRIEKVKERYPLYGKFPLE